MINGSEKAIKDLGDKADKSDVDATNKAIEVLKEAIKTDEVDKIKDLTMKLTEGCWKKLHNKPIKSKLSQLAKRDKLEIVLITQILQIRML